MVRGGAMVLYTVHPPDLKLSVCFLGAAVCREGNLRLNFLLGKRLYGKFTFSLEFLFSFQIQQT